MRLSYWEQAALFENLDYCIVGAGVVGSCTGIFLKEKFPNARILIVERGSLPQGASTKNAGFACFGSISEMEDDLNYMSESELIALIKLRIEGLNLLKNLVPAKEMDFHNFGGYELFETEKAETYLERINYFNDLVKEASGLENTFTEMQNTYSDSLYKSTIFNQYEGQLNPMKMLSYLHSKLNKLGVHFLFGNPVNKWSESNKSIRIGLKNGFEFECKNILHCTNAFAKKLLPELNLNPGRNQVLLTEPINDLPFKGTYHMDGGYVYFRNVGKRLLIGGARNIDAENESTSNFGTNDKVVQHLKTLVSDKILPSIQVDYAYDWSGILAFGETKTPIVRQISDRSYAAVRLGGMGVAIGSKISQNLVNLIKK